MLLWDIVSSTPNPPPPPPLSLCGCCHFEGNYTWPRKHLPISRSLINYCPCRFGSRTEEPNAESRRTSYIKVQLLLIFIYFLCNKGHQGRFISDSVRHVYALLLIMKPLKAMWYFFSSSFKWLLIINTTRVISLLLVIRPISFDIIAAREFYFLSQ